MVRPVLNVWGWPEPRWWRALHRVPVYRVHRFANWLYARRYGHYAPGFLDCVHTASLHSISPTIRPNWEQE